MEGIQNVLLVAYLLIVLALIAVILLQRSEGGGLGMGGNAGGLMTVRGSANLLTRTTAVLAALFFATAIGLTILSSLNRGSNSILDSATTAGSSAPSTILDALSQLQGDASAPVTAPAADTAPADQGLALPLNLALPQVSEAPSAAASSAAAPAATTSSAAPEPSAAPASSAPPATSAPSQ
jgi:preprotein translocase subunit SecG